jgi:hypothetical protein
MERGIAEIKPVIWVRRKQKSFCKRGWTSKSVICPVGRFSHDVPTAERYDRRSVKCHIRGGTEQKTFMTRCSAPTTKRKIAMKLTTIALATAFALSSTFALAQAGGAAGGSTGGSTAGGASMSGSGIGTTTGGATGTTGMGSGSTTAPAVQNPRNTMNPSGNTLAPNGSPSGSTLGPTGPGTGR